MFNFLVEVIKVLVALAGIFVLLSFIYFYALEIRNSLKRKKYFKAKAEQIDKKLKEDIKKMDEMYKKRDKK